MTDRIRTTLRRPKDRRHPKAPDFNGVIEVDGKIYFVGAWLEKLKHGAEAISLRLDPKEDSG